MATGTRPSPSPRRVQSVGAAMLMMGAGAVAPALAQQPQQQVELPAVTVTATEVNESPTGPVQGFVARRAVTATKTDTPLMETPQSITVITRDRMELQGAQSVQQAVVIPLASPPPPSAWTTAAIRSRSVAPIPPSTWMACSIPSASTTTPVLIPMRWSASRC